jgi:lysophospholipase
VALRAAHLPAQGARRGRVALLHGRTEFLEKYIEVAAALSERGFDVVSTDWRGQGRSDRLLADARRGHVGAFADYQRDLKALLAAPEAQGDGPLVMLAHSMGGAIGLRALDEGHDFKAAIFSAPMWGVKLPLWAYPVARLIAGAGVGVGLAGSYAPGGGGATPYALRGFDDNLLTADREQFDRIADRTREAGEYALGGRRWAGSPQRSRRPRRCAPSRRRSRRSRWSAATRRWSQPAQSGRRRAIRRSG